MDAALAALGAAGVTAGVGFASAAFAARNEQRKWLREQRLRSYIDLMAAAQTASSVKAATRAANNERVRELTDHVAEVIERAKRGEEGPDELDYSKLLLQDARAFADSRMADVEEIPDSIRRAGSQVRVLGPASIDEPALTLSDAALQSFFHPDEHEYHEQMDSAEEAFVLAARRAIGAGRRPRSALWRR